LYEIFLKISSLEKITTANIEKKTKYRKKMTANIIEQIIK